MRGVDACHTGEGLDEAGDGTEQTGQGGEVAQHGQVASSLFDLRHLAQRGFLHGRDNLGLAAVGAHEAGLNDASHGCGIAGADFDGALNVARRDLRTEQGKQLVLVNHRLAKNHSTFSDDRDGDHQNRKNGPHAPSSLVEGIG